MSDDSAVCPSTRLEWLVSIEALAFGSDWKVVAERESAQSRREPRQILSITASSASMRREVVIRFDDEPHGIRWNRIASKRKVLREQLRVYVDGKGRDVSVESVIACMNACRAFMSPRVSEKEPTV